MTRKPFVYETFQNREIEEGIASDSYVTENVKEDASRNMKIITGN